MRLGNGCDARVFQSVEIGEPQLDRLFVRVALKYNLILLRDRFIDDRFHPIFGTKDRDDAEFATRAPLEYFRFSRQSYIGSAKNRGNTLQIDERGSGHHQNNES